MNIYVIAAGIILCLCCSAFFSASEMSYSSCNTMRLENARDEGSKRAGTALRITESYDDALGAILIGNNLANIAASSLASVFVIMVAGEDYAWLSTVMITLLVIIFGETIPKISAKKNANSVALRNAYLVRFLMVVLKPMVWLVVSLIKLLTHGMKGDAGSDNPEEAREELQSIIETAEDEAVLNEDQSELVQKAIDFPDVSAFEVMTARVDMQAIDIDDDWDDIMSVIEDAPYSRIPVYEGSIDNIIGVLYLNHFLKAVTQDGHADIRRLLMPPCYVYKTMKLPAVLNLLRRAKQHLAIVSDEYGGTLGVVSMEDVLEQIVGEIWDETDTVEPEVVQHSEGEYELDGDMVITDFLELVGLDEAGFEFESGTLGGWTIEVFDAFPKAGDFFNYQNITVKVLEMNGRRVEKILVTVHSKTEEE